MQKLSLLALTLGLSIAGLAPQANAQAAACKNTIAIDSVYQTGVGQGKYEYFVQIRNRTQGESTVTLEFGEFPSTVTLFSRSLPTIRLKPNEPKTIRFGTGSNGQISLDTVKVYYDDRMSLPKPYVVATKCATIAK